MRRNRTALFLFLVARVVAAALPAPAAEHQEKADRVAWRYAQKDLIVTIARQEGKQWVAQRSDGQQPIYDETGRTGEYIELQNRQTKLFVRLHNDRAFWRRPSDADWTAWVKGGWVDASGAVDPPRPAETRATMKQPDAADDHRIRLAYFVPSDRKPTAKYEQKIRVVMAVVAEVYRQDLRGKGHAGDGLRFESEKDQPAVRLVRGEHPASHYNNAPRYSADEQWRQLLPEIRGKIGDPQKRVIVVFTETYDEGPAEHLWPGVIARGGYNNADGGLAVFSAHVLRDEFCALTVQEQQKIFFDQTPVRGRRAWGHPMNSPRGTFAEDGIGAVAHELGHALGLPHDRRDDARDIMGNGFRNLRWNFAARPDQRVHFSEDNARLLMCSRYLAKDLDLSDRQPPQVEVSQPAKEQGQWVVNVSASDDTGLRAIVFVDRSAGSVIAGRALSGKKLEFRQQLKPADAKSRDLNVQVIIIDNGGNQTRTTVD